MLLKFKIFRFDPETDAEPYFKDYSVEAEPSERILDCLNRIKWEQDGTLSYRHSCAHGVCGSDAMKINGTCALACQKLVKDYVGGRGDRRRTDPHLSSAQGSHCGHGPFLRESGTDPPLPGYFQSARKREDSESGRPEEIRRGNPVYPLRLLQRIVFPFPRRMPTSLDPLPWFRRFGESSTPAMKSVKNGSNSSIIRTASGDASIISNAHASAPKKSPSPNQSIS